MSWYFYKSVLFAYFTRPICNDDKRYALSQWFSHFTEHQNFLVKTQTAGTHPHLNFLFSGCGVGPENLYFHHVPRWCWSCWAGDQALEATTLNIQDCVTTLRQLLFSLSEKWALGFQVWPWSSKPCPSAPSPTPCITLLASFALEGSARKWFCFLHWLRVLHSFSPHQQQSKDGLHILWRAKRTPPSCLLLFSKFTHVEN